ncbi:hypothetical protein ACFLEY_22360 [Bradyrhizobium sp. YCK136]|jgi:hypothetical protein|uniref:Uncharacterized protein n=1 Tax=Bradyrhizobium elkanii TaxID=29448 RepID=A0ABV4F090_BRAEL|nr:hypothetical protein [Bradyrhizobium elkanii]MCP1757804.1 hypothetical protein [Bradyrhizobium elkanii]MCS3881899.1 hypothetical protein [Bradyrhizobium elkanii]MCS4218659.1 hypothetical protein [Bradyrhizobium elkanii]MCW2110042.1 hypothetical protein [Bradyrhizobium elkanii]MCW2201586.1 hypothetical protein [Bradyrhizobium elkanii]
MAKQFGIRRAHARLKQLLDTRPQLFDQSGTIRRQFREAVLKDERGVQAHRYVDDWIERLAPMR